MTSSYCRTCARTLALTMSLIGAAVSCKSNQTQDDEPSDTGGNGGGGSGGTAGRAAAGTGGSNAGGGGSGGGGASGGAGAGGTAGNVAGAGGSPVGGTGGSVTPVMTTATCVPPKLKLTRVAKGSDVLAIAQASGDPRMFVLERAGLIRIFVNGTAKPAPFLDLRAAVVLPAAENERGLLNMALHPQFTANGRFFVFYTRSLADKNSTGKLGDLVIAEGKAQAGNPDVADAALKVLKTIPHQDQAGRDVDYHNGGFMAFGADGMLYVGTGEAGKDGFVTFTMSAETKPQIAGSAQNLMDATGKILRIDVDRPTERPTGNFESGDVHVWAIGMRNPFRGSFDRATGDLYVGDVGEGSWEEIDFVPRGATMKNFGWGQMEGTHCFPWFLEINCTPILEMPLLAYPHDGQGVRQGVVRPDGTRGEACGQGYNQNDPAASGDCARAVIGGVVYRGKKIPELYGRYLYGDFIKNWVKSFVVADGKATCEADLTADLATTQTRIQALQGFGEDADGEAYVLDQVGNVYRIDPE